MPGTEQQPVLEDSDDDFKYEEVEVIRCRTQQLLHANGVIAVTFAGQLHQANTFSCSDNEEDAISEDLDAALHSLQTLTAQVSLGRGSILVPAPHAWRASSCPASLASWGYFNASILCALLAHTACGTVHSPPGLPADQWWQSRACIQAGAESWGSQQAA